MTKLLVFGSSFFMLSVGLKFKVKFFIVPDYLSPGQNHFLYVTKGVCSDILMELIKRSSYLHTFVLT